MTTLALFAITVYAGQYVGQPLYCDAWDTVLMYDATTPPWVAMPDSFWQGGGKCWDRIGIRIGGVNHYYYALDRMAPSDWYVIQPDGAWLPIMADLPAAHAPFPGLSAVGQMWSVEPIRKRWEEYR